jgi:hypothetical protein
VGQTAKELREAWRKRYEFLLDSIFEECVSHKITVSPDQAMDLMEDLLESLAGDGEQAKHDESTTEPVSILRFDSAAYRREAHYYAVTRFYKTYVPRKRGAPPLPTAYLDRILRLRFKGLNYVVIAEKLGQPKGRMKKQVAAAERRWRLAVERIEQIKKQYPQLVAQQPAGKAKKQRTPDRSPNARR